jgi:hypothetical protein
MFQTHQRTCHGFKNNNNMLVIAVCCCEGGKCIWLTVLEVSAHGCLALLLVPMAAQYIMVEAPADATSTCPDVER